MLADHQAMRLNRTNRWVFSLLLSMFLMVPMQIIAQLQETDTTRWHGQVAVGGRQNTGNFERWIITPEATLAHVARARTWGFATNQRYTYGTFGKAITENDLLSRNFVYLRPTARVYPYLMVWLQTSVLQQLSWRQQIGLGVTWAAWRAEGQTIKLSATVSHEQNRYASPGLTVLDDQALDQYQTLRLTLRAYGKHQLNSHRLSCYYEVWYQPNAQRFQDWRLYAEAGVLMPIYTGLSGKVNYIYDYATVHQQRLKPFDAVLAFGLNYQWQQH